MEEIKDRCISKKEYLKKYDSNVGYALYVQDNIKKDDYARLNTGEIVKVIGIRENNVTKKAIYFGIYDEDWCDSAAVENFSENIIDLIEVGDIVNDYIVLDVMEDLQTGEIHLEMPASYPKEGSCAIHNDEIKTILTKEQYMQNCYKIEQF